MSDAVLIAAHGSRDASGVKEFWEFAEAWQALRPDRLQAAGFLEFARPTIGESIDALVARGARRITVVPAMLTAAGHVKNDVPSEIREGRGRHPGVTFRMARALDVHASLLELCRLRYREAVAELPDVPDSDSMLLLVGRGTSDPDANASIARVSRFLWESYGVGWAGIAFSGVTPPGVDEALGVCRRLGFRRIIVQPYFLFDGVLLKRISEAARRHAGEEPGTQFVLVSHLRTHPLLVDAFEDRVHEAAHGTPNMNCDLCKYRVRLHGREADLGSPQEGGHHHVRASPPADEEHPGHPHRPARISRRKDADHPADPSGHPWDERLIRRLQLSN